MGYLQNESVFSTLVSFVERQRWKYKKPLNRGTRLVQDLKMEGDDAYEFMEKFVTEFNIDYSEFKYEKYFSKEGFDLLGVITSVFRRKKEIKESLTLGDLEEAIIRGKFK